jgi:NAD(P)-dependent dehydrogenase (short-subunit alcohol dehydrogenase family)
MTFRVNIHAMFYLTKAAVPHMKERSSVINTTSINADTPNPTLLAYATTKGAIQNFTAGLAQLLAEKGIRANAVAPGPIWTPLIPSTMPEDAVENFGKNVPMKRPGQPAELATAFARRSRGVAPANRSCDIKQRTMPSGLGALHDRTVFRHSLPRKLAGARV